MNWEEFLTNRESLMAALALPPVDNHTHSPVKETKFMRFTCNCGESVNYDEVFNE